MPDTTISGSKFNKLNKLLYLIGHPFFPILVFVILKLANTFHIVNRRRLIATLFVIAITLIFTTQLRQLIVNLPNPENLKSKPPLLSTKIFDRHGNLLYTFYNLENRSLIELSDLPNYVPLTFIAIEDKNFYKHRGISITGIFRAARNNLLKSESLQGGSTITQQLVKNSLLTKDKTWQRKLKEIILAVLVERRYSKQDIIEMYLNQVNFGGPIYGIEEASQQYFGIPARNLSLAQSAFLAGLPKAPTLFSPYADNSSDPKQRQVTILNRMHELKLVSDDAYQSAIQQTIIIKPNQRKIIAPHFVMYIYDLLKENFSESIVREGGLRVYTTLDQNIQQLAQDEINQEITNLGKKYHVNNGASLVINPATGELLAMVGSLNYFDTKIDGQVNLTTALRQPGSTVKPINYSLALESGMTPASTIEDRPIQIKLDDGTTWVPKNYDNRFHGPLTLRSALANSYNIPAINTLSKFGPTQMASLAKEMGLTSWNNPNRFGLSITLGALETSLLQLSQAYSVFANYGKQIPIISITKITDSQNRELTISPCKLAHLPDNCFGKQIISPETSYTITDILSDNYARAKAFGLNSVLNTSPLRTMVKTGTSNNLRDNWTIGFTPDILVATWVGNNDNTPMNAIASGITGASPIWNRLITKLANPATPWFTPPSNLARIFYCPATNSQACPDCQNRYEYFSVDKKPRPCPPKTQQVTQNS